MATKKSKTSKTNSSIGPYPRAHARLDNWVGKEQYTADGVSTDTAILWGQPRKGPSRQSGEERALKANHPIV